MVEEDNLTEEDTEVEDNPLVVEDQIEDKLNNQEEMSLLVLLTELSDHELLLDQPEMPLPTRFLKCMDPTLEATGYCARAVRTAIEAATGKTIQRTQSAKNYGPNLEKAGFRKVSGPPRIGDVAIFNSVPGHPHGHIQVLTERGWVSDFKQRDQYPGPAYRNRQAPMQLYRAE
nr:unnamed protein product [Naegleria fowleri]